MVQGRSNTQASSGRAGGGSGSSGRAKTFSAIIALEVALLAGLLCVWVVRMAHTADAGAADRTAETTPPQTLPSARILTRADDPPSSGSDQGPAMPSADKTPTTSLPRISDSSSSPASEQPEAASSGLGEIAEPSIVISKSRKRLYVFDGEELVASYPAAVGSGRGDKEIEGDCCTPEGRFYVCVKNPHSRYVLSLGLSYPNAEDAARGLAARLISPAEHERILQAIRQRRQPPWNTALGGEIMIHGRRDGGRDTLGCIALEDEAIRELYPRIETGTVVEIRP